MRLFIAIQLDNEDYFHALQTPFQQFKDARITFPHSFHLTLKFLGDIGESLKEKAISALSQLEMCPVTISINHMGTFPNQGSIQVLWAGFAGGPAGPIQEKAYQKGYSTIIKIQRDIDSALKPLGFPVDDIFFPHVTLARIKSASPLAHHDLRALLLRTVVAPNAFHIDGFSLIKSTLGRQGPIYETVWKSIVNR